MPLRDKLITGFWLTLWITVPYYSLQYIAIRPVQMIPALAADSWVPFEPLAVWPYLSLFVFMPLTGWLILTQEAYYRWSWGVFWLGLVAALVFLVWPNGLERNVTASSLAHELVLQADRIRNAFPSLHAAFAVYCSAWAVVLLQTRGPVWQAVCLAWALLILWSTLALRQHVLLDIIAGGALGALMAVLFTPLEREIIPGTAGLTEPAKPQRKEHP